MLGQALLDAMEALNQELQLQTNEADVTRGLLALNMAQDYFESLAAQEGAIKGDSTTTVVTAASTETTSFPDGWLRVDSVWFIDPTTSRPSYQLDNLEESGSHAANNVWPAIFANSSPGAPQAYFTNARSIYWSPLPDDTHTLRIYGFAHASDITAAGTFAYDDALRLPFASFAVQILRIGVGDDVQDVSQLAKQTLGSAIAGLAGYNRDGASPLVYRYGHNT